MRSDAKNRRRLQGMMGRRSTNMYCLGPIVKGVCPPTPCRFALSNHISALSGRLARPLPPPVSMRALARRTRQFILHHREQLPVQSLMSFHEWLENTHYSGGRKSALTNLYEEMKGRTPRTHLERELQRRGLPIFRLGHVRHGERMSSRDEAVDMFIKNETYPESTKAPRFISARVDAAKVFFGPLIKTFERVVYEVRNAHGRPYFIKHVPVDRRPEVILGIDRDHAGDGGGNIATDYKTFEAAASVAAMSASEHIIYRYLAGFGFRRVLLRDYEVARFVDRRRVPGRPLSAHGPGDAEFADITQLTDIQLVLLMFIDMVDGLNTGDTGWLRVLMSGLRMSGEMNTSLGNGLLNLLFMNAACAEFGLEYDGFVEGDDGIFHLSGAHGAPLPSEALQRFGALIKLERVPDIARASFCGNVFDRHDKRNVGDVVSFLAHFGWYTSATEPSARIQEIHGLLRAKAMSALAEYHGTPIIPAFARYVLRNTMSVRPKFHRGGQLSYWDEQVIGPYLSDLPTKIRNWACESVGSGSRALVAEMQGISVSRQLEIEEFFDDLSGLSEFEVPLEFPAAWREYYQDGVYRDVHAVAPQRQ